MIKLPYPPSLNRYLRHTGRTYKTDVARKFQHVVELAGTLAGWKPLSGDVAISITLHPKLTAKGKPSGTCIDLDNSLKVVLDALQGVAYLDDAQVKRISAEVGPAVKDGGLTVQVFSMGQGGIPAVRSDSEQPAPPLFVESGKESE